jgi:hypothetical protein
MSGVMAQRLSTRAAREIWDALQGLAGGASGSFLNRAVVDEALTRAQRSWTMERREPLSRARGGRDSW